MLITKYFYIFQMTPIPVSPMGEKPYMTLLPLWGKVGKGVINTHLIIVLFMIPDTHSI
jgi:hypothetical protein